LEHDGRGLRVHLPPAFVQHLCEGLGRAADRLVRAGRPPVVLVSPEIRAGLKQLTASRWPELVVISAHEITPETRVEVVRTVDEAVPIAA